MGACAEIYRAHYAPCIRPRNILSLVQEDAAQQCIHVNENTGICQCHHQKMKESQALQSKGMLKEYLLPDIFPLCNLLSYVLGCCNSLYKHYKGDREKLNDRKGILARDFASVNAGIGGRWIRADKRYKKLGRGGEKDYGI